MQYEEYVERFLRYDRLSTVRSFAHVNEGKRYPLLSASTAGSRTLLITSGFHGDETAGPLTLLEHFDEVVAYARSRDVGLQVYPCINPSGFEDNTRYNRSKELPNNDFLRYQLGPCEWVGELPDAHTPFTRYRVQDGGPKETRAIIAELERQPTPAAALDIHQDPYLEDPLCYAYSFGSNVPFRPLLDASARVLPVARSFEVDDDLFSDGEGLVKLHDGSVTDYYHRRGVPFTVALETTTIAAMPACHHVNLIWIKGFIDLCARQ